MLFLLTAAQRHHGREMSSAPFFENVYTPVYARECSR